MYREVSQVEINNVGRFMKSHIPFHKGYIVVIHDGGTGVLRAYYTKDGGGDYHSSPASDAYRRYVEGDIDRIRLLKPLYNLISITRYQERVYETVRKIPPGETMTYKEVADIIGSSPRAVGQALSRNPFLILVPCHRVVARHGLGGFTSEGGLELKNALLRHEKRLRVKY